MNSQTPTPDDGHPRSPSPGPGNSTEPPPAAHAAGHPRRPRPGAGAGHSGRPPQPPDRRRRHLRRPPTPAATTGPDAGSYADAGSPASRPISSPGSAATASSRGRDRWIGGVSSGIAQRLGIDPLIVRGIFIVLTLFAGIGVLLYGLAWAFLPEPDGRIHVQEAGAGRWTSGMTGSLITTILGFTGLGGGFWGWGNHGFGAFLWTVFWVGGAIYLIYYLVQRNKARNGAPMAPVPQPAGTGGSSPTQAADLHAQHTPPYSRRRRHAVRLRGNPLRQAPPLRHPRRWPLGSGGSARLAALRRRQLRRQPAAAGPAPPRPRSGPPVPAPPPSQSLPAAALLVGGGLKALDVTNVIDLGNSANAIVWASAAAVLGLGILIPGLRGRTSGILGFFAVVALIIGGIFNVVGNNGDRVRFQQVDWAPDEHRAGQRRIRHHGRHAEPLTSRTWPWTPRSPPTSRPPGHHGQQRHGGHPGRRPRGHQGRHDHGQPQRRRQPRGGITTRRKQLQHRQARQPPGRRDRRHLQQRHHPGRQLT